MELIPENVNYYYKVLSYPRIYYDKDDIKKHQTCVHYVSNGWIYVNYVYDKGCNVIEVSEFLINENLINPLKLSFSDILPISRNDALIMPIDSYGEGLFHHLIKNHPNKLRLNTIHPSAMKGYIYYLMNKEIDGITTAIKEHDDFNEKIELYRKGIIDIPPPPIGIFRGI